MNILKAINVANEVLKKNFIKSAKLDSEILLSKAINKDRKYIILNLDKELKNENLIFFNDLIAKRSLGKPIAYLIGKKDFWKYEFNISQETLIPRPDSEILIDYILKSTKQKSKLKLLDIGIGSGCILLSILKEKKDFYGTGIDISNKCIEISKINASKLNLSNRVKFFKSNVDNFNYGKYDLIISNPPYIKKLDLKYLDRDVIDFEPKLALDGGLEGISEIRKVINRSSDLMKKNGKLVLEIGFDQKYKVKKLLKDKGFYINKVLKDYANNDRCIVSTKI
ncbi:peptide chain release factor N(5)-glutamine methyltransferase [Candidatus Pelagibacter sp.]|nr:peptide chain release factor N(5)-glutamine methyltransferase [Candidatus Pelagibacter sp.]